MENTESVTYEIPSENRSALEERLTKLARKAAKCGAPIAWTWGAEIVAVKVTDCRACAAGCGACGFKGYRERKFRAVPITVSTARPCFAGWTFLGAMDHTSAAPAVLRRMVPGVECPAYAIAAAPGACDHCGKVRRRSETFVVQHADGAIKVVGRQCVADFLGHASAADLAGGLSYLLEVGDLCAEESEGGFGRARWDESTLDVLIQAFAVVRVTGGFRPSAFDEKSTRSLTAVALYGARPNENAFERANREALAPTLADCESAWSALEWLSRQPVTSDYMSNLVGIASSELCSARNYGILVSLTGAYARARGEEIARAARVPSAHVGVVGERQAFGTGTVERVHAFEGNYGFVHFVTVRLDGGAILSWKASNKPEFLAAGARVNVTAATVKAHSDYRGTAQTEITRANVAQA